MQRLCTIRVRWKETCDTLRIDRFDTGMAHMPLFLCGRVDAALLMNVVMMSIRSLRKPASYFEFVFERCLADALEHASAFACDIRAFAQTKCARMCPLQGSDMTWMRRIGIGRPSIVAGAHAKSSSCKVVMF